MDITYLLLLQNFREATQNVLTTFFSKITLLGGEYLTYLLIFWLYWCVDKAFGVRAIAATAFGRLFNGFIKQTCCVYRPWVRSDLIQPYGDSKSSASGYSFPSGHTTNAALTFGHVGWHYRKERLLSWTLYLIVALVMLSRNYLGVHTPQDVLVGLAVTAIAVFLGRKAADWMEGEEKRDVIFAIGICAASALLLCWFIWKPYPMDYDDAGKLIVDPKSMIADGFGDAGMAIGAVLGILFEKRFVRFGTEASFMDKCTRFAVGALVYTLLKAAGASFFTLVLGAKTWGNLFGKSLMFFYAVGGHPLLFTRWERSKQKVKA